MLALTPSRGIGWAMAEDLLHRTHPEVVKRLKRAEGHLRATITMIEAGRPCLDLAQQLHAVEKAISEAKRTLIHDHVDHCLEAALDQGGREQRTTIEEFRSITRYL
jgi:DNA-binding FrmR family transcriptional regulator